MYEQGETIWFNQELYRYRDKQSDNQTTLRLSLLTTTTNFQYFNQPFLSLQIGDSYYTKTATLYIQDVEDLYQTFASIIKTLDWSKSTTIERRYQSKIGLSFTFEFSTMLNNRIVKISIISNESDIMYIVLPIKPAFQTFVRRLKYFVEGYDNLAYQLLIQSTFSEERHVIRNLPLLIKSSIAQLSKVNNEYELSNTTVEASSIVANQNNDSQSNEDSITTDQTNEEFERFIEDNINTIEIPEIDKLACNTKQSNETTTTLLSNFASKMIDNNLNNLEIKLNSLSASSNAITFLTKEIFEKCEVDLLKDIPEKDLKSLVYLSKLFKDVFLRNYTINGAEIASSLPVLRFKPSLEPSEELNDIWKSILTCTTYIRVYRNRLKGILTDAYENGSIFYLHLRCFMDAFCFSFLSPDSISLDELKSTIQERFKSFEKAGVFDYYKNILDANGVNQIDVKSILDFITKIYNSLEKIPYVHELHQQLYDQASVKLAPDSSLTIEQIIEEFIPFEVSIKISSEKFDNEALERLKDQLNVSDEIFQIFTQKQTKKRERIFPLLRFINNFKQDIPSQYIDSVLEHIKTLEDQKFNFQESQWPLQEFDEDIVKALYVWDPENDSKMKTNYSYFASLVKDESMSKENILLATQQEENNTNDDWNSIL